MGIRIDCIFIAAISLFGMLHHGGCHDSITSPNSDLAGSERVLNEFDCCIQSSLQDLIDDPLSHYSIATAFFVSLGTVPFLCHLTITTQSCKGAHRFKNK